MYGILGFYTRKQIEKTISRIKAVIEYERIKDLKEVTEENPDDLNGGVK